MPEMNSLTLNDKTYDCFVDSVARSLASASAVIKSASGESITVSDSSHGKPYTIKIYGRTTQDGVPTPDAPVELVSVGDSGSITVNVTGDNESQSVTVATPNGLPGIPVASGGNYTDANGQQWICDEINLARGVYVKRVVVLDDFYLDNAGNEKTNVYKKTGTVGLIGKSSKLSMCTITSSYKFTVDDETHFYIQDKGAIVYAPKGFDNSNNVIKVLAVRQEPYEIPLSAEEIAAYAAIHTYRDHTAVSNDAGAWMDLEYVMDAKKYIDSLVTGGIIPATVE